MKGQKGIEKEWEGGVDVYLAQKSGKSVSAELGGISGRSGLNIKLIM
jgi:hypothetical protein